MVSVTPRKMRMQVLSTCMRMVNSNRKVHTSLVMSKTKVAPIKRLSIPRLELYGAQVLTQLLRHAKDVLVANEQYFRMD